MSDSLQAHGLQHARLPCPLLSPGICSLMSTVSMMPSTMSSSVTIFSCPQSFPASRCKLLFFFFFFAGQFFLQTTAGPTAIQAWQSHGPPSKGCWSTYWPTELSHVGPKWGAFLLLPGSVIGCEQSWGGCDLRWATEVNPLGAENWSLCRWPS